MSSKAHPTDRDHQDVAKTARLIHFGKRMVKMIADHKAAIGQTPNSHDCGEKKYLADYCPDCFARFKRQFRNATALRAKAEVIIEDLRYDGQDARGAHWYWSKTHGPIAMTDDGHREIETWKGLGSYE